MGQVSVQDLYFEGRLCGHHILGYAGFICVTALPHPEPRRLGNGMLGPEIYRSDGQIAPLMSSKAPSHTEPERQGDN